MLDFTTDTTTLTEDDRLRLKVASVDLHAAADVMRRKGFTRGTFYNQVTGRVCMLGALRIAIGGEPAAQSAALDTFTTMDKVNRYGHAANELRHDLDMDVEKWNDGACDGGPEAIAALETTAARCEQQAAS